MNKIKKLKDTTTIFVFLIKFLFLSCSQNNTIPERVGSTLDSKISGTVTLYNDLLTKVSPLGMTVAIEATGYSTTTDSNGKYVFKDVKYGTYNFIFAKPGYGTSRIDTFKHVDNNDQVPSIVPGITLGAISGTSITGLSVDFDTDMIIIKPSINPAGTSDTSRGVRLFYGLSPSVSKTEYTGYSNVYGLKNSERMIRVAIEEFTNLGFTSGSTVYVKAYGESFIANDYLDLNTGKRVFPNLNAFTVDAVSFQLP